MNTTWKVTEADRDAAGNINVDSIPPAEPRSLADLLPTPQRIKADAQRTPMRTQDVISAAIVVPLMIGALLYISRGTAAVGTVPTAAVRAVPTAAVPTPPPVAMLPAYGAPNEAPRWQIEATRTITPTAHYGADWIFATVQGSGTIWLRASDFPQLAIIGKDLAQPTPLPYVAPTPEPQPPCHTAGMGNQQVTVCDWLSAAELESAAAAKWAATYGGTIGTVSTPSPQPWDTVKPNSSIAARQKLIGSDPNALACQNAQGVASPLCGGLTNAAAQAALDKETP